MVFKDHTIPESPVEVVTFVHDGNWYEAMDQGVSEYSARRKGGRVQDYDRLELVSFVAINREALE